MSKRDNPVFPALSISDYQKVFLEPETVICEVDHIADTESGIQHKMDYAPIPDIMFCPIIEEIIYKLNLFRRNRYDELLLSPYQFEILEDISRDPAGSIKIVNESPYIYQIGPYGSIRYRPFLSRLIWMSFQLLSFLQMMDVSLKVIYR